MAACTESPATCSVLGDHDQTHQTPPQKPLNQDLRSASGLRAGHRPVTARLPSNISVAGRPPLVAWLLLCREHQLLRLLRLRSNTKTSKLTLMRRCDSASTSLSTREAHSGATFRLGTPGRTSLHRMKSRATPSNASARRPSA